ncbi:MAG TPA: glycine cleavage system aminomethyltransferase GcvT, partial [Dehalococcoidia bacterium]|nr:glycine cleavage system aminomethyltransferase GcvT [Dehalococcoidia bacterium]
PRKRDLKLTQANLRTALYDTHLTLGARMVPFGGWDMPVQYSGILAEVKAVRTAAGLFDVSHMGRLYISGPQATEFLDWVLTSAASTLRVGRARYCFICNERGGVIDDTIFYRLAEDRYLLIPNAGNRPAVLAWFEEWVARQFPGGVAIQDRTQSTGLLALQGPGAAQVLDQVCRLDGGEAPSTLRAFAWGQGELLGKRVFLGRTGYTGEDGFELVTEAADAESLWRTLQEGGALPCGLGARDVLRLEAGLPLHGHEIDPETSPIEAGLERFVRQEGEFVGADVLRRQQRDGVARKLVGLTLSGRSAPRAGYPILAAGQAVGHVTSGSYSPTLDTSIAMGYVLVRYSAPGQALEVDIRGRAAAAEVVPLPFYTRPKK